MRNFANPPELGGDENLSDYKKAKSLMGQVADLVRLQVRKRKGWGFESTLEQVKFVFDFQLGLFFISCALQLSVF